MSKAASFFALLLTSLAAAHGASPPSHPANLANIDGYWVGQSEPTLLCRVVDIAMSATPGEDGRMRVVAEVRVSPEFAGPVPSTFIGLGWVLPDGSQRIAHANTDTNGVARFEVTGPKGMYHTFLTEVKKTCYVLDRAHSELREHLDVR